MGGKVGGSHTSVTDTALPVVDEAKKLAYVSRVILGPVTHIGSGPKRIRFTKIPAGLKIAIRGGTHLQTIYVYTAQRDQTTQRLKAVFT